MMELGPLEYAILGNVFLLLLLFIILVYTFVRLRKVSKEKGKQVEYVAEPHQNYSTLCGLTPQERKCFSQTLPHPAKKSVRIDERREQPLWIAVPHPAFYPPGQYATLNIPVKKPSQRTHSCKAYQSPMKLTAANTTPHSNKQLNLDDFYGKY